MEAKSPNTDAPLFIHFIIYLCKLKIMYANLVLEEGNKIKIRAEVNMAAFHL